MIDKLKIPNCWEIVKLSKIAHKVTDGSHNPPPGKSIGIPMISAKDVQNNSISFDNPRYISDDDFRSENKRTQIQPGDVLLTIVATIGRTAVVTPNTKPFTLQRSVAVIKTELNPLLLCYYFQSPFFQRQLTNSAKGTAQKGVYLKTLNELKIILPPTNIHNAIVSKIEELFSELDKGIEELKTAQQQLKVYRQAVLKWAFEGKLTNEDVKYGLPEGWKNATIGNVCTSVEYGSATKSKATGKIPVLRMGNIQNGIFDWEDLVYTDDEEEINKYILKKNDVLFNRTNSAELVGKTAIYKGERPAIFAGYLIRINRIEEQIDASYLTYYLNSKQAKSYGNSVRSFGVNQSNINGTKLKTYPLPLPPLEEQKQIVQEIESRLSVCDKIEETIINSLKQAEALRQSILKKAFEGKLIS